MIHISARNYLIDPISPCRRIQLSGEDTFKKEESVRYLTGYEMKLSIYSSPKKKKKEQRDAYTSLKKKKKKKILLLLPPFIRPKFRRPKKSPPRGISC